MRLNLPWYKFRAVRLVRTLAFQIVACIMKLNWFRAPVETQRVLYLNARDKQKEYPDNTIRNTKYTVWSFLPKNLLEQFGRFMNLYFLLIACLQLWPLITPVDPASTWVPLIFIFMVSAIKEAIDDINRARRDSVANNRKYTILERGVKKKVRSSEIRVGDFVFLEDGEEIPCDLALLLTSDEEGVCFIQTSNIDGESDLKSRFATPQTRKISLDSLGYAQGILECGPPDAQIYKYQARLRIEALSRSGSSFQRANNNRDSAILTASMSDDNVHKLVPMDEDIVASLNEQQFLPQGTLLKNTDWLVGIAVYTGNQTKVGMNKGTPPMKWTRLDRAVNRLTMFIFAFQFSLVFLLGLIGNVWQNNHTQHWYLQLETGGLQYLIIPLRFLLLNSMMIPISLKVTLDIAKFYYAYLINWDLQMYDENTDQPAQATSTAISEDLGQIEYVMSDKTGTLTENRMSLVRCAVKDTIYGVQSGNQYRPLHEDEDLLSCVGKGERDQTVFFLALALCHSAEVSTENNVVSYRASSPDEEALLGEAAMVGVKCVLASNDHLHVKLPTDQEVHMERIVSFPFTSDRRRMSVLLREEKTRKIHLYCKGADDVLNPRLTDRDGTVRATMSHVEQFALQGLRTLLVTHREIDEETFQDWHKRFLEAQQSLTNRESQLSALYEILEQHLDLLGATAIEDKLQPGVPEAINTLRRAGVRVWMLTGDKPTTALQIALSCSLLTPKDVSERFLRVQGDEPQLEGLLDDFSKRAKQLEHTGQGYYVMLEGRHLHACLKHSAFADICIKATSVICSRVTPHQKAEAVQLVRDRGFITLAIGDGGNDVSMIQRADIGVGIFGREGLQASRAADYAISRFRFLVRLMLIHGRHSYLRTSFLSQYSFFKSMIICCIQILYSFYSGFAGTSFFNTFALTFYNVVFTSIPPLASLLDKDFSDETLINLPHKYKRSQAGKAFTRYTVILWILRAIAQACIVFFFTVYFSELWVDEKNGHAWDYQSVPMVAYTSLVGITTATVLIESTSPTMAHLVACSFTILLYFMTTLILGVIHTFGLYQVMPQLVNEPAMWLCLMVTCFAALSPIVTLKGILLSKEGDSPSPSPSSSPSNSFLTSSSPLSEVTPLVAKRE